QSRGEKLEMLLSVVLWCQDRWRRAGRRARPRIVAMVASAEVAGPISAWLDATVVPCHPVARPVPLYEGWLNERGEHELYADPAARELLPPDRSPPPLTAALTPLRKPTRTVGRQWPDLVLLWLIRNLVAQDLRVLVYAARKHDAEELAMRLRKWLLN